MEGSFRTNKRSDTGRIYVPAALVRDSQFPLNAGKVHMSICTDNKCGIITLCIKPAIFDEKLIIESKIKKR